KKALSISKGIILLIIIKKGLLIKISYFKELSTLRIIYYNLNIGF
ncbi:hypothetical protein FPSE_11277, partial [Fusarium pseudograminearum CS3096]